MQSSPTFRSYHHGCLDAHQEESNEGLWQSAAAERFTVTSCRFRNRPNVSVDVLPKHFSTSGGRMNKLRHVRTDASKPSLMASSKNNQVDLRCETMAPAYFSPQSIVCKISYSDAPDIKIEQSHFDGGGKHQDICSSLFQGPDIIHDHTESRLSHANEGTSKKLIEVCPVFSSNPSYSQSSETEPETEPNGKHDHREFLDSSSSRSKLDPSIPAESLTRKIVSPVCIEIDHPKEVKKIPSPISPMPNVLQYTFLEAKWPSPDFQSCDKVPPIPPPRSSSLQPTASTQTSIIHVDDSSQSELDPETDSSIILRSLSTAPDTPRNWIDASHSPEETEFEISRSICESAWLAGTRDSKLKDEAVLHVSQRSDFEGSFHALAMELHEATKEDLKERIGQLEITRDLLMIQGTLSDNEHDIDTLEFKLRQLRQLNSLLSEIQGDEQQESRGPGSKDSSATAASHASHVLSSSPTSPSLSGEGRPKSLPDFAARESPGPISPSSEEGKRKSWSAVSRYTRVTALLGRIVVNAMR